MYFQKQFTRICSKIFNKFFYCYVPKFDIIRSKKEKSVHLEQFGSINFWKRKNFWLCAGQGWVWGIVFINSSIISSLSIMPFCIKPKILVIIWNSTLALINLYYIKYVSFWQIFKPKESILAIFSDDRSYINLI